MTLAVCVMAIVAAHAATPDGNAVLNTVLNNKWISLLILSAVGVLLFILLVVCAILWHRVTMLKERQRDLHMVLSRYSESYKQLNTQFCSLETQLKHMQDSKAPLRLVKAVPVPTEQPKVQQPEALQPKWPETSGKAVSKGNEKQKPSGYSEILYFPLNSLDIFTKVCNTKDETCVFEVTFMDERHGYGEYTLAQDITSLRSIDSSQISASIKITNDDVRLLDATSFEVINKGKVAGHGDSWLITSPLVIRIM